MIVPNSTQNPTEQQAEQASAAPAPERASERSPEQGKAGHFEPDRPIDQADLETIRDFLNRTSGIQVAASQAYLVVSRLAPLVARFDMKDVKELMGCLRSNPPNEVKAAVIEAMTTNETSFFRNDHLFDSMVTDMIPKLLESRASNEGLVIWCAACSSGQEVYSLAISLYEHFPELVRHRRVRLLASDLSPQMVKRTRAGRYSQFEVSRGLEPGLLNRYFHHDDREWVVKEPLMKLVETRQLNLLEPWNVVPPCDVVLMRNVLIYFSPQTKSMLLERVHREVLRPDGYLVLGASESVAGDSDDYRSVQVGKTVFFQPKPSGA